MSGFRKMPNKSPYAAHFRKRSNWLVSKVVELASERANPFLFPNQEGYKQGEFHISSYEYELFEVERGELRAAIDKAVELGFFLDTGKRKRRAKIYKFTNLEYIQIGYETNAGRLAKNLLQPIRKSSIAAFDAVNESMAAMN